MLPTCSSCGSFLESGLECARCGELEKIIPVPSASIKTLSEAEEVSVHMVACWRCGLLIAVGPPCRFCKAKPKEASLSGVIVEPAVTPNNFMEGGEQSNTAESPRYEIYLDEPLHEGKVANPKGAERKYEGKKLLRMLTYYFITLFISILWTIILASNHKKMNEKEIQYCLITVQVLDGLLACGMFYAIGFVPIKKPSGSNRALSWCLAPFASVLMFLLMTGYVHWLRSLFHGPDWMRPEPEKFSYLLVFTAAVMPALMEEFFFRYFALGTLQKFTHVHSAVAISSFMFAFAHLYNPLGVPMLFLMGLALGYARVWSGGLLLPMLMHFAHNFMVILT